MLKRFHIRLCVVLVLYMSMLGCVIEKLPTRLQDDGYSSLSLQQKCHLTKSIALPQMCCTEITAFDIARLCKNNKLTWITILASWCPHTTMAWQQCSTYQKKWTGMSLQWLPVFLDYNIRKIHQCDEGRYNDQQYIIVSNADYGGSEWKKEQAFYEALTNMQLINPAVPLHLVFDEKAQLLFQCSGTVGDPEEIVRLLMDVSDG